MNNTRMNGRTIGIIILVVIVAGLFLIPRLFNNNNPDTAPESRIPAGEVGGNGNANIQLGSVVTATGIDRDGCATQTTNQFSSNEPVYVVAEGSTVPAGTTVFVRLYQDGQPVEDAPQITADQDYRNSCINFVFEPTERTFEAGNYEAEFFINGNPADSVSFEIR